MKNPNGYGSVIKLGGRRRKPYAVRISSMQELPDGTVKRRYTYLAYFSRPDAAIRYLADYNSGNVLPEHMKYADVPTFAELYEKWKVYRNSMKNKPSDNSWRSYDIAFGHLSMLHHRKITSLKAIDLQNALNTHSNKSRSSVTAIRVVLKGIYSYAIMNEYIDSDLTLYLHYDSTDTQTSIHSRFSDEEIRLLWKNLYIVNNVDIVLIYIYTGLRPTELLEIRTENVHLQERYMVGGLKTENGYDRLIPLCDKVLPLIQNRYDPARKYLINNKMGNHYTYGSFTNGNWNAVMRKLELAHSPHDGRYTFISMADEVGINPVCLKIIVGHAVADADRLNFKTNSGIDITKGIYTQKSMEQLLSEVNKLP